jgi:hypothetical protein
MKGAIINFDISPDGKKLKKLTYKRYWYCGKLEYPNYAPNSDFDIKDGKVSGEIKEGDNAVAFTFKIDGAFTAASASGVFQMTLHPGNCNTGKLNFTALGK